MWLREEGQCQKRSVPEEEDISTFVTEAVSEKKGGNVEVGGRVTGRVNEHAGGWMGMVLTGYVVSLLQKMLRLTWQTTEDQWDQPQSSASARVLTVAKIRHSNNKLQNHQNNTNVKKNRVIPSYVKYCILLFSILVFCGFLYLVVLLGASRM